MTELQPSGLQPSGLQPEAEAQDPHIYKHRFVCPSCGSTMSFHTDEPYEQITKADLKRCSQCATPMNYVE